MIAAMILLLLDLRGSRHTHKFEWLAADATPALAEGTTGTELAGATEGVAAIKAEAFGPMSQGEVGRGLKASPWESRTERERDSKR